MEKSKEKLSQDAALAQMQIFLDYYDIAPDELENQAQREAVESAVNRIVRGIRKGQVEISDGKDGDISVIQHLKYPPGEVKEIQYSVLKGIHKSQMDNKKMDQNYGKIHTLIGALSGLGESAIRNLKAVDLSIAESLGALFLQA